MRCNLSVRAVAPRFVAISMRAAAAEAMRSVRFISLHPRQRLSNKDWLGSRRAGSYSVYGFSFEINLDDTHRFRLDVRSFLGYDFFVEPPSGGYLVVIYWPSSSAVDSLDRHLYTEICVVALSLHLHWTNEWAHKQETLFILSLRLPVKNWINFSTSSKSLRKNIRT